MERINSSAERDDPADLPGVSELEAGCFGYGAYTDQNFGVTTDEGEVCCSWEFSEIERDSDVEGDDEYSGPVHTFIDDETHLEGVWILYHASSKGSWGATVELAAREEFDASKLRFEIKNIEGFSQICTGFSYDGIDHFTSGDTSSSSISYFLVVDGHFRQLS